MAPATDTGFETADLLLEMERVFDAPPALVFRLWSSPDHIARWWGPKTFHLSHCEMDFRPGGAWRFCMQPPVGDGHWIHGIYREIRSPERLSFTYINDSDGHEMLVTLDFAERDGKTVMKFRQANFLNRLERDDHNWGWSSGFDIFARYVLLYQSGGLSDSLLGWRQGEIDGVEADLIAAKARTEGVTTHVSTQTRPRAQQRDDSST